MRYREFKEFKECNKNALFPLRGDNEFIFLKIKNWGVGGIVNCDSNERGVSSSFICYRLGKISKYIFTTGYANVTAYKKRACSPPIVAKSGERFDCSFPKKGGGAIEHFAEKQPDAPSRWHSRASVTSLRVVPGAGCRGGASPCKKSTRYSYLPILGTEHL